MNAGRFRTCLISLLMVLVVCGTGAATVWDYSDYIDNSTVHICHVDQHDTDMEEVKLTISFHNEDIICPNLFHFPEPEICDVSPTAVQLTHYPLLYITASFPSRASPA